MEDEFQYCPHCDTLNFAWKKTCSECGFRLPDLTEHIVRHYRSSYIFLCMMLLVLGAILIAAFV
jgi:hypothetical protein